MTQEDRAKKLALLVGRIAEIKDAKKKALREFKDEMDGVQEAIAALAEEVMAGGTIFDRVGEGDCD